MISSGLIRQVRLSISGAGRYTEVFSTVIISLLLYVVVI